MRHSQFKIGLDFWCGDRRFRCTDVGGRVVVAIRIDAAEVTTMFNVQARSHRLTGADAEAQGLFVGPPYAVAEVVFDEDDLGACFIERAEAAL